MARDHLLTRDESALVLACARTRIDPNGRAVIDALLRAPIRWEPVLAAANAHGVLPLVHAAIQGAAAGALPASALEHLRREARANVHHALYMTAELLRLLTLFERASIPAIPFKGPVLAETAYGDITLRQFTDLDIFVRRSDLATLARLLLADGYLSAHHDGAEATARAIALDGDVAYRGPSYYTFYRRDGRCRVDLQWRMADRFFSFSLDGAADDWQFAELPLAGRAVRSFAVTDALLILCVHGSKHQWEKLKWICDIAEFTRAQRDAIDWERLRHKASRLGIRRMVDLGLVLAQDLLGTELPARVAGGLRSDRSLSGHAQAQHAILFGESKTSASSLTRLVYHLRIKDRGGDRLQFFSTYARQVASRLFKPNAHDTAWVRLPSRLAPLYYVVRPLRLLGAYASDARRSLHRRAGAPSPPAPKERSSKSTTR